MSVRHEGSGHIHALAPGIGSVGVRADDLAATQFLHLERAIEAGVGGDRDDHGVTAR